MASLWKRSNSKYFHACFTDRTGKQRKRSTGTTDRKQAMKLALKYEEAARQRRTAKQARTVIADLHKEITHEELSTVTLRVFFMGWLERKRVAVAASTFAFYAGTVSKFLAFMRESSDVDIAEVTREHITAFRNAGVKTLSSKTVNHDLKCLKMIFKAARSEGALIDNPCEFVDTVRQAPDHNTKRRAFTIQELRAVLSVADVEWGSLIRFGVYTGQRLADLSMLTWANIDLSRDELRLVTRKTGRRMILPLAKNLRKHLENLPSPRDKDGPVHPRAFEIVNREGKTGSLSNLFADLLARAGLREKKSHKRHETSSGRNGRREANPLSFHSLRHTATSLLHEFGVSQSVAQEFVGHDSAEIHRHYVGVGDQALRQAADTLPDLD